MVIWNDLNIEHQLILYSNSWNNQGSFGVILFGLCGYQLPLQSIEQKKYLTIQYSPIIDLYRFYI